MEPLISILIPTYNRPEQLKKALLSALCQNYRNIEIIVSDNSEGNETQGVVEQIFDEFKRVKISYCKNPKNIGPILNWNNCLNMSSGEYAVLLPDDDYFINPSYIDESLKLIIKTSSKLIITNCIFCYPDSSKLPSYDYPQILESKSFFNNFWTKLSPIPHISNVFETKLVKKLNCFNDNDILFADIECWLKIAAHSSVSYFKVPSVCYNFHSSNIVLNMNKDKIIKNSKMIETVINYWRKNTDVSEEEFESFTWKYIYYATVLSGTIFNENEISNILSYAGLPFSNTKFYKYYLKKNISVLLNKVK